MRATACRKRVPGGSSNSAGRVFMAIGVVTYQAAYPAAAHAATNARIDRPLRMDRNRLQADAAGKM